jgi:hypothetical protein
MSTDSEIPESKHAFGTRMFQGRMSQSCVIRFMKVNQGAKRPFSPDSLLDGRMSEQHIAEKVCANRCNC